MPGVAHVALYTNKSPLHNCTELVSDESFGVGNTVTNIESSPAHDPVLVVILKIYQTGIGTVSVFTS